MTKLKIGFVLKSSIITILILLLVTRQSFCQDPIISYVKINGNVTIIIKIDSQQLKTVFLNDIGVRISESGFYDSLSSDNYIYKKYHNESGQSKYFYNTFFINKTQDSAIFQLENKRNFFKKNIGCKIKNIKYQQNKNISLTKDKTTKLQSIIYVFSSGCPQCTKRLTSINTFYTLDSPFSFLALLTDSSKLISKFYRRQHLQIPLFQNQNNLCNQIETDCDEVPFFLVVDLDDFVVDCFDGNEEGIDKIKQLLR